MNRQDFDKWVENEIDLRGLHYTVCNSNIAFKSGADAAYNLLSDPDYSQEQEIKELHSIVENLKREHKEEIERLKGLIDVAWDCGYDESSFAHSSDLQANYDKPIDKEQFKKDNQL